MSNFYTSIDEMPIYNWHKINETGDVSFILIKKKRMDETLIEKCIKQLNFLYEEYISKFGFNEIEIDILEKQKEIALLIIQKNETGDMSLQTMINIRTLELNKILANNPKGNFFDLKTNMEKALRFRINIKECSVTEFYSYLKNLTKK